MATLKKACYSKTKNAENVKAKSKGARWVKIRVYTDGACKGNPGPGGWAAIILFPNKKQSITGYDHDATNNRMELTPVIKAIALATGMGFQSIAIHSDSAYVVNAINNDWLGRWASNKWKTQAGADVKNVDLWIQLKSLLDVHKKITFVKVKGHNGDHYNEEADQLAKREIEINA